MSNNKTNQLLAEEGLNSITQKLYNTIYVDLPSKDNSARRWIWELMQNAKDVFKEKGEIRLTIKNGKITFSHTGDPFNSNQLRAVLSQNSSKEHQYSDDEKYEFYKNLEDNSNSASKIYNFLSTTGRFGTGFMTTYLLSKNVTIKGAFKNENGLLLNLNLPLDRKVSKQSELGEKVKESFRRFSNLEDNYNRDYFSSDTKYKTEFIYDLSDGENANAIESGLEDISNSIDIAMILNPKIESFELIYEDQRIQYESKIVKKFNHITLLRVSKAENSEQSKNKFFLKNGEKNDAYSVIIPVNYNVETEQLAIIELDARIPRQYIYLPLVGSESLPIPFVSHSPLFNPNDPRSTIFLKETDQESFNKKVQLNRNILKDISKLYLEVIDAAIYNRWNGIYNLSNFGKTSSNNLLWIDTDYIPNIISSLKHKEIIKTQSGALVKPLDILFPIGVEDENIEEFWEICSLFYGNRLPKKEQSKYWSQALSNNEESWNVSEIGITHITILELVSSKKTIHNLASSLFDGNASLAYSAVNKLIGYTEKVNASLLNNLESGYSIFPNQVAEGEFKRKSQLHIDDNIPDVFKDASLKLGKDWYSVLISEHVEDFKHTSRKGVDDVSEYITKVLNDDLKILLANEDNDNREVVKEVGAKLVQYTDDSFSEKLGTVLSDYQNLGLVDDEIVQVKLDGKSRLYDWNALYEWLIVNLLNEISKFGSLSELSTSSGSSMVEVIGILNKLMQQVVIKDKSLLRKFAVLPNQSDEFCLAPLLYDNDITKELKEISLEFNYDVKSELLHKGFDNCGLEEVDDDWICKKLDDLASENVENELTYQAIRNLDKWITKFKDKFTERQGPSLAALFKFFYGKRSGLVLNTYPVQERNRFDKILNSGLSAEMSKLIEAKVNSDILKEVTSIMYRNPNMSGEQLRGAVDAFEKLSKDGEVSAERINALLRLEELSKGYNTDIEYSPSDDQIRENFKNGWKGEAFIYTQLNKINRFHVDWRNLTDHSDNVITDFEGNSYYVNDRGEEFDIVLTRILDQKKIYLQVKSTVTDLSQIDNFGLPISTREWKFIENIENESEYYIVRVFNLLVNPKSYYLNMKAISDL